MVTPVPGEEGDGDGREISEKVRIGRGPERCAKHNLVGDREAGKGIQTRAANKPYAPQTRARREPRFARPVLRR
jgi:hypothetical protein